MIRYTTKEVDIDDVKLEIKRENQRIKIQRNMDTVTRMCVEIL